MNISIVIPNYNGEKIMEKNLPRVLDAVKDYKNGEIEIIIPDDPSTDNSREVIVSFIKSIKQKNIKGKTISNNNRDESGFSKNVNRGVSLATGDILVLLNTDVVPHKNFLDPILPHFNDTKVFAVGCLDESIEDKKIILRGRGVGKWIKGFLIHSPGSLDKTNSLWAGGGSSAFRKKTWDELGGLNELFNPYYWEDIDVSYRAQKVGYKIIFEKKSRVIHEHEKGAIKTSQKQFAIRKISYRNQFFFVWINITDSELILSHFFWLPYHFLTAFLSKDLAFFAGFFSAVRLLPNIISARKKVIKKFVTSDKMILSNLSE